MSDHFETLVRILNKEYDLYAMVRDAGKAIHEGIVAKNAAAVKTATRRYDMLSLQIEEIEEQRLLTCDTLGKELGLQTGHVGLLQILSKTPPEIRPALETARGRLKGIANELANITAANRILLEESLRDMTKMFEIFTRSKNRFAGYGHTGNIDTRPIERNLINHVA